jgi:transcriptional regulator with XRE-family HTH domain
MRVKSGRQLRAWRDATGKTQQEVAKEIGFAYFTMISQLELGRSYVPPERYVDYAKAMEVDLQEFVKWQLRWSNPWAWTILYGTPEQLVALKEAPDRARSNFDPEA